ncbi:MAG: D-2-hydroxyacid dehydrogenase [Alphaproteobacteria bacterium]
MADVTVLAWLNDAGIYRDAIIEAGLDDAVTFAACTDGETPAPELLAAADALLAWKVPPGALRQMPRLRWIQALTVATDGWLRRDDLSSDVALTCARGVHAVQMPENILGVLLHITRGFAQIAAHQAERRWTRVVAEPLAGKTLGLVGLGAVGAEVAARAGAFGMRVIGTRAVPAPVAGVDRVYAPDQLDRMLAEADFVVLLAPVTPATVDLIDADRLGKMKRSAWLLNFARGELVVDRDLIDAVTNGVIRGAVLDVFRTEPLPADDPLWSVPGITILPHIGGLHPERNVLVSALLVENLKRFLAGSPFKALVNRDKGY